MPVFYEKGKKYNCRVKGIPYFRTSVTINGKSRQVYGDGEKDAKRRVQEIKDAVSQGFDPDRRNDVMRDVFDHWLYDIKRVNKNVKASSFEKYEGIYRNHIRPYDIVLKKLASLSSADMQAYVTWLYEEGKASGPTIKDVVKLFKMFLSWAIDEGYLVKNPCRNLSLPGEYKKTKDKIEVFSPEERAKILNYISENKYQYATLIRLAFATGMRQGELLALKWSDIENGVIHVQRSTSSVTHINGNKERIRTREVWEPKTANAVRDIPLLPQTADMLRLYQAAQKTYFRVNHLGSPTFVFTTSTGQIIDANSLIKSYKGLLQRAGVPYRKFHAIRHTFATEAIRHGVDVKDLQMLMGHSDLETTYIYVQSDRDSKRRAIEMMGSMM